MAEPLRALSLHLDSFCLCLHTLLPLPLSLSLSKLLTERKDITKQSILVHSELSCYAPVTSAVGLVLFEL